MSGERGGLESPPRAPTRLGPTPPSKKIRIRLFLQIRTEHMVVAIAVFDFHFPAAEG